MVEEKEKQKEKERTRAVRQQPRPAAQRECGRGARASSSPSLSTPAHPRRLQSRETCDGHVERVECAKHVQAICDFHSRSLIINGFTGISQWLP